jgi:hypothetical protein
MRHSIHHELTEGKKTMGKKVVDAKQDSNGNITAVKLTGNSSYTPLDTAMKMADRGQIDNAHSVRPKSGAKPHLRTNPDAHKGNNLDEMAQD